MTNVERTELKKAMDEKKLIRTYKDSNGVDAMTDPIPVWKLEQLMVAFGQVSVLEKQVAELKDELKAATDDLNLYKSMQTQAEAENAKLREQLQRLDDERLMKLFEH